jgi:hypothetical protein
VVSAEGVARATTAWSVFAVGHPEILRHVRGVSLGDAVESGYDVSVLLQPAGMCQAVFDEVCAALGVQSEPGWVPPVGGSSGNILHHWNVTFTYVEDEQGVSWNVCGSLRMEALA